MDEFKDVMLSEPPSRFMAAAPQMHATSLENYKGILLCDRPTDAKVAAGNEAPPFLPAGKEERFVGLQPSVEYRSRLELSRGLRANTRRVEKTALTKHRHWLAQFSNTVKQNQLDKIEDSLVQQDKQLAFREKQAEMRKNIRDNKGEFGGTGQQEIADESLPGELPSDEEIRDEVEQRKEKAKSAKKSKSSKSKPKWAMTEEEAIDDESNQYNDLISFARNLDFDRFINDYEVQEALAIMRDRVQEIAKEQGIDPMRKGGEESEEDDSSSVAPSETSSVTSSVRRVRREARRKAKEQKEAEEQAEKWNSSTVVGDKLRSAINNDALQLADRILGQSDNLRQIHSKQSLARILQDVALDPSIPLMSKLTRAQAAANIPTIPPVIEPKVSTVQVGAQGGEDEKQRRILTDLKKSKDHVQNLPYLYRCPSI